MLGKDRWAGKQLDCNPMVNGPNCKSWFCGYGPAASAARGWGAKVRRKKNMRPCLRKSLPKC